MLILFSFIDGSRLKNIASILSKGLQIEPPGVQIKPYYYGRGIYFADSVSNSAAYCDAEENLGIGLLLLCEVALGSCDFQFKPHPTYSLKIAENCMSVKAVGQYYPHPFKIRPNGLKIPNGPLRPSSHHTHVELNEFVATHESQVKIRYLVKMRIDEE